MAQDLVATVREAIARWNTGDRETLPDIHPDFELTSPLASLRGEPYLGSEGLERWIADIDDSFGEFRVNADEFRRSGNTVLVLGSLDVRGRESGVAINQPAGWLLGFEDDLLRRVRLFTDPAEAERAAAE